jgi:hypothetical protein
VETNGTSFHDSSLVAIVHHDDDASLSFENVYVDGVLRFAEVILNGVIQISRDNSPIEKLEIVHDDGEVLELSAIDGTLTMLVEWVDYKRHLSTTHSYQITCKSIVSRIGSISPDNPAGT